MHLYLYFADIFPSFSLPVLLYSLLSTLCLAMNDPTIPGFFGAVAKDDFVAPLVTLDEQKFEVAKLICQVILASSPAFPISRTRAAGVRRTAWCTSIRKMSEEFGRDVCTQKKIKIEIWQNGRGSNPAIFFFFFPTSPSSFFFLLSSSSFFPSL